VSGYTFRIDKKLLDEVNASQSGLWTPPADVEPTQRGDTIWMELVHVSASTIEADQKHPERTVFRVEFTCAADSPPHGSTSNPNVTRRHTEYYRLNGTSLRNENHPDRTMTRISIAGLRNVARAAGLWPDTDDVDLEPIFGPDSEGIPAPVVGSRMWARVRLYNDKTGTPRMELARFMSDEAPQS
jgi:hypothetical protein